MPRTQGSCRARVLGDHALGHVYIQHACCLPVWLLPKPDASVNVFRDEDVVVDDRPTGRSEHLTGLLSLVPEPEQRSDWTCNICQFLTPVEQGNCRACGSARFPQWRRLPSGEHLELGMIVQLPRTRGSVAPDWSPHPYAEMKDGPSRAMPLGYTSFSTPEKNRRHDVVRRQRGDRPLITVNREARRLPLSASVSE